MTNSDDDDIDDDDDDDDDDDVGGGILTNSLTTMKGSVLDVMSILGNPLQLKNSDTFSQQFMSNDILLSSCCN